MPVLTLGKINIASLSPSGASVTLDNDPDVYKNDWPRRQSIEEGLAGAVTKQDAGRFAKDLVLKIDSGPNQWLNIDTVRTLEEFAARKGATFTFTDAEGNEYTVTFEDFTASQAKGMKDLYVYVLELHVFGITKRLGVTYTGA